MGTLKWEFGVQARAQDLLKGLRVNASWLQDESTSDQSRVHQLQPMMQPMGYVLQKFLPQPGTMCWRKSEYAAIIKAKVSLHVIFAVFLKMYQLHTECPPVQQNSDNPLPRVKNMMQCINRQSTVKLNALSRLENANLYSCISKSTQRGRLLKVNLVCSAKAFLFFWDWEVFNVIEGVFGFMLSSYPLWTVIISASPSAAIILPTDFLYYDIAFDPVHVM
ncbi:hypothetical protein HGM15179_000798 [Zosterops borbonicus]|uniref:Uncharacterized protein n=1 Tax=Zosterops borbonicus TaxID=364589 RepID=A0A8K1GYH5_9PASS|nr:hypothetical protein HGM15179_000798 [Zosterops borbonicus]